MQDDIKIKEFENTIDNYIDKGFFVVPCKDKIPQMPSWNNAEDQTKDEVLDFIKSGRANQIGIRTDKYFVIDVDVKHNKDGFESLKKLSKITSTNFDETLCAETRSGGRHYFFLTPEDQVVKNTVDLLNGIDIRGKNGFVVAYPSQGYKFLNTNKPKLPNRELLDYILKPIAKQNNTIDFKNSLTKVDDGRENLMTSIVYKHYHRLLDKGEFAFENLYDFCADEYFSKAKARNGGTLEDEGRGETALRQKCERIVKINKPHLQDIDNDTLISDPLGFYTAEQLMSVPVQQRQWVWDSWHLKGTVANIYGIGGVGKSTFLLSYANFISLGKEYLGFPTKKMKTLCVFCEEDDNEIARRQQSVQIGYNLINQNSNLIIMPRVGFDNLLVTYDMAGLPKLTSFFYQLLKMIKEERIEYVILDTLSDIFGGSEIVRSHVNYFMKSVLGKIIRETGCSILVSGHPSQSGTSLKGGFSGSTAWQGATRSLWYMQRTESGYRELIRLKSNYSLSGEDVKITLAYEKGVFVGG